MTLTRIPIARPAAQLDMMSWTRISAGEFRTRFAGWRLTITHTGDKHWTARVDHANAKPDRPPIASRSFPTRRQCAAWCCETVGIRRFHSFGGLKSGGNQLRRLEP